MHWRNIIPSLVVVLAVTALHAQIFLQPEPWQQAIATALLVGFALVSGVSALIHLCIILLWASTFPHVLPEVITGFSAMYLAIVFILSTLMILPFRAGRKSLHWFRKGQVDRIGIVTSVAIALLSGIALIVWGYFTDNLGAGKQMVESIAHYPSWLVLGVGVPIFALLNAFSEEMIFRGVFQEAAMQSIPNLPAALVLQAMAFASIHVQNGFPNGLIGYIMTFTYALLLGWIRWRSSGILLPYVTHVAADLVIASFLYLSL